MERTQTTPTPYPAPIERDAPVCDACRGETADRRATEGRVRAEYAQLLRRAHRHLGLHLTTGDSDPDMDEALRRARAPRKAVA